MNIASPNIEAARSPLSESPPRKVRDLPKSFVLEQLELYYQTRPPEQIVETDYSLWECVETRLQFAWPMLPGNVAFYEWVSQFSSYYPGVRWEYGEVRRQIASGHPPVGRPLSVLDVGCGKGDFLRGLDTVATAQKFALDLNEPAVQACREQGFQACCGTVESALAAGFVAKSQFPVVTSFHCLEHVEKPVEFVRALAGITAPGGRLFISTPYSPMSFETDWFDILNHPPHHMTRWNAGAYRKLADILGLKMRWFAPPANVLKRTLGMFRLLRYGPNRRVAKARLLTDLLLRFPTLARCIARQSRRGRKDGEIAADVILVEFTIP